MKILLLSVIAALLPGVFSAQEGIPLKFSRPAGKQTEGITFGIPFARGKVKDIAGLQLQSPDGKVLPLQSRATVRWQDHSVKWGLFHTAVRNIAGAKFVETRQKNAAVPSMAKKTGNTWLVKNGKFTLSVPEKGPLFILDGVPAEWTMRLNGSPGPAAEENWLVDAGNPKEKSRFCNSGGVRKITVEENGPVCTSIALHGTLTDSSGKAGCKYILRLTAYKDDPVLRVQNTFIASWNVDKEFLRAMAIRLNFPVKEVAFQGKIFPVTSRFSCNIIGTPRIHHLVSWKKKKAPLMRIQQGEKVISGQPAAPAELTGGNFTIAVRDFQHLYPKELAADSQGLIFGIWPEPGNKVLDLRRRASFSKQYHDYHNPYGGHGAAKTHELYIAVGKKNDLPARSQNPVLVGAAPEYYRDSRACGDFMICNPKEFPKIEALSSFHFRYLRKLRIAGCFDGMMDWGDVPLGINGAVLNWMSQMPKNKVKPEYLESSPFRGYWGWCNGDFAICHGFFLYFLRSGDFSVLRDGIDMARHIMDVDTVHDLPQKPEFVGLGRRHDQQHWGSGIGYGYAPDAEIYMYLLTGDHRALEVVKETANSPCFYYGRWVAIRLWELTGEEKYLTKARKNLKDEIRLDHINPFNQNNFRFNSYDAPGMIFTDQILNPPELRKAAVKAAHKFAETWPFPLSHRGHPPYAVLTLAGKYAPDDPLVREVMKIRIEMLKPYLPKNPETMNKVTDKDSMEIFDRVRPEKYPDNTSVMSLYIHTSLPYMLEQLRRMKISEEECLNYQYRWVEFPAVREEMDPKRINKELFRRQPHDYMYPLKTPLFRDYVGNLKLDHDSMMKFKKAIRRLKMYEDGRLIGPVSWRHRLMWQNGTLGFSCWGAAISMTTQDNSDPRTNGRKYVFEYTPAAQWKWKDVPSFSEPLKTIWPYPDVKKISGEWCASLEHESPLEVCVWPEPPEWVKAVQEARKRHRFTEDGKELSTWRRDQNLIIFKTSDNSDPRSNGRKYILNYKTGETK